MGLFDKLFKKTKLQQDEPKEITTPDRIINSAGSPLLPPFTFEDEFGEKAYSFQISSDFTVFNSHSEMEPSFQYYPFNDDNYNGYDDALPIIAIGPNDKIYDACSQLENGEDVDGLEITPVKSSFFLFKATFEEYGKINYAYGFSSDTAREWEGFILSYNPDIKGTALEQKLMTALDEAVRSYTERELD